jgi:amino acid transporter
MLHGESLRAPLLRYVPMSTQTLPVEIATRPKGLRAGAVGLGTSVAVGMASTAPAYSLAATLGFVVAVVGIQTPLFVLLAFVPMFFAAWATKQMNRADPDCGTSFAWAARAFGPRTGWFAGGWGTIAADFLAMASYAQIAGQYVFLLVGAEAIGHDATSVWVLLVGIGWIVVLTTLCYLGIEISARLQVALIVIECAILLLLGIVALVKVADGTAPVGHLAPSMNWFDPGRIPSFTAFMQGMLLMIFIYWGWDTTTSINEETSEPGRIPGKAGVISTFLLLGTYLLVVVAVEGFAGVGKTGIGLDNPGHQNDVLSVLGTAVFGSGVLGEVLSHLLIFMVLTSAAATTQTTILPNARTMLSMAFHKALPPRFGRIHPRYLSPTFATLSFGVASIIYYIALNFISGGSVISDAVTATTFFVALYLGITAASCAWHYRSYVGHGLRMACSYVVTPALGAFSLFFVLAYSFKAYWPADQSYFETTILGLRVGGIMLVVVVTAIIGLAWMAWLQRGHREYFSGEAMASGLALTDADAVVRVSLEPDADSAPLG